MKRNDKHHKNVLARAACAVGLGLALTATPTMAFAEVSGFTDVNPGDWYAGTVEWATENDVIHGPQPGIWDPLGEVDRAQAATILFNYSGDEAPTEPATWADASTFGWAADSLAWAQDEGVFNGYDGPYGNVGAWDKLTREQAATILCNMFGTPSDESMVDQYADANSVSGWARGAVAWAIDHGIMGSGGFLAGQTVCSRAEFVTMLMRITEGNGKDHAPVTDPGTGKEWVWVPEYQTVETPVYEEQWVPDVYEGECWHVYCIACGYGVYIPWDIATDNMWVNHQDWYWKYDDVIGHVQHNECNSPHEGPIYGTWGTGDEKVWHTVDLGTGHYEQVQTGTKTEQVESGGHWEAR